MTGPLFLVTVSRLASVMDCTALPEDLQARTGLVSVLDSSLEYTAGLQTPDWDSDSDQWVPCFIGVHKQQLAATMAGLLFFVPSATMAAAYFEVSCAH
jgi:hypothetical protein